MANKRGKKKNQASLVKIPKHQRDPRISKHPKSQSSNTGHLSVHWSFDIFDDKAWHDNHHKEKTFRELVKPMRDYGRRTWSEIEADRKRDHSVPRKDLCQEAQERLEYLRQDDVDELWRFRFTGIFRIWGIREGRLFKVLWLDPQHKICPSKKKHT